MARRTVAFDLQANEPNLLQPILHEKVHLLFEQLPIGITAQIMVSVFLFFGLWPVGNPEEFKEWFLFFLLAPIVGIIIWWLYIYSRLTMTDRGWIIALTFFTLLTGMGWGISASVLMPASSIVHQSFVIILIIGVTAGGIPFFSPVFGLYCLFLLTSFFPLVIWLFLQGNVYTLLGYCGLIYTLVILASAYYFNRSLTRSLELRYKNINLDSLNQHLEKRVAERTAELEKTLAITKSTLESTADGILLIDLKGKLDYFNQKFLDMWQIQFENESTLDLQHFFLAILPKLQDPQVFLKASKQLDANDQKESFDEILLNNGSVFEWHSKPHWLRHQVAGRVWCFRDITMRKQMEMQLSFQANHDLLTHLPNRSLLYARILHLIHQAKVEQKKLVLIFLDIDHFKLINDNLGHDVGDILLKEIADRLHHYIAAEDTVARFGGDEFVILHLAKYTDDIFTYSNKILEKITAPMTLKGRQIVVTASIGISLFPNHGDDAATLLKNADMAMYVAKSQGRNNCKLYNDVIHKHNQASLDMQIDLRNALLHKQFFLVYQPVIELTEGKIIGAEALVRLRHPKKGILLPHQFIPIAEESGLIIELGQWVFEHACTQNKRWQDIGLRSIRIAINVSSVQLVRANFFQLIETCIKLIGLDPQYIEIELTESIFLDDRLHNLHVLKKLNEMGVHLAIDDFGVGFSSLNYLRRFPVSKLKIDQSFINNCVVNPNDASLVEAIIAMGHGLKIEVLAEGVETNDQLTFLKNHHCDQGQGFLFRSPMNADSFANLLAEDHCFVPSVKTHQ